MNITSYIASKESARELFKYILEEDFHFNDNDTIILYEKIIKKHIDKLIDECHFFAEFPYVDKVYRDSYYHYFSSKLTPYLRDCARISIFNSEITMDDFRDAEKITKLQEKYLGYFVLRPTSPFLIGRSFISPKALKENNFICCTTKQNTTANSVKFEVEGFPHSSQDTETISCAETTIWAIMEYFSGRYADYKPVLPSKIIDTLNLVSSERQIPSKGLNIQQMSFALKEFGFGTRIYSSKEYGKEFEALLSCYIESGIPVIVAMESMPNHTIGHALLCIGHEVINGTDIDKIPEYIFTNSQLKNKAESKNIHFYDTDYIEKAFIFIDDNQPIYQKASLKKPALHYDGEDWKSCQITHFIAPLYQKMYMEAFQAKSFIYRFLLIGPEPLSNNKSILIRFFLASSRTFKDSMAKNNSITADLKDLILEKQMPKFIWVAELSDKENYKKKHANGIIIVDATESNIYFNKPLILAAYEDKIIDFEKNTKKLRSRKLSFENFCIFEQNLKTIGHVPKN